MIVDPNFVGDVWPAAQPGHAPADYGHASIEPMGCFPARSQQTFTLVYHCGRYGLDDTGSIRLIQRVTADGGSFQTTNPKAANYVTAKTSNGVALRLEEDTPGFQRPWMRSLILRVAGGYLAPDDQIIITVGDRRGGSPGFTLPSFCETAHEFKIVADVIATGHYMPVPGDMAITVSPGPPVHWHAVLPSLRQPGETFRLGIKAEDKWGNPSDAIDRVLRLECPVAINNLPETVTFSPGMRSVVIDESACDQDAELLIEVSDAQTGETLTTTNPLQIINGEHAGYWGDLHGQTGETVGVNTI